MSISKPEPTPCWKTAATDHGAQTSPADLSALGDQLSKCHELRGRPFVLRCQADALAKFAASHLMTTAMCFAMVAGLAILVS